MTNNVKVKILRSTGLKTSCRNGYAHNLGNHTPGSKWSEMDYLFATWLRGHIGEEFTFEQFRNIYSGLLMASGFDHSYARKMSTIGHLDNGPAYAEFIQIINEADLKVA